MADNRQSLIMLTSEQIAELAEEFASIDTNGDGKIQVNELQRALKISGIDLPGYEVRNIMKQYTNKQDISMDDFRQLYSDLKRKYDIGRTWKDQTAKASNLIEVQGASETATALHSIRIEEQVAFSDWINKNLSDDRDLVKHLPIKEDDNYGELYDKCQDGIVICKLINVAAPETIDERALNKSKLNAYTIRENQTLALNSAQAIGCTIVNMDADDLAKGKQHLVLGLLWQIIRNGLFAQISLTQVPGLFRLLHDGETLEDLQKLSPEEILKRWVNYHMEQAGESRRLNNFEGDVKDSHIYTHLLYQIAPKDIGVKKDALRLINNLERAEQMLCEADKLKCRAFVRPKDVANGNYKLNLAFTANLFNTYPGLPPPGDDEKVEIEEHVVEETREEKTYRNWMNSMGVTPFVNHLYGDLQNGIVIFQLYDVCRKNVVDWKRVVKTFKKMSAMMDQIGNCNYAVDLGKQLNFSLVGIQGKDIYDGNRTLTLSLVWQLMRAYTLNVLAQCTHSGDRRASDKEIVEWANAKLRDSGKSSSIRSFQDPTISDSMIVCELIDAIQPGTIQWDNVRRSASEKDKLANAKYALTCARKIGARVYALPEDIVEVKPKMVMTVFACLMARDYMPDIDARGAEQPVGVAGQLED